MRPYRLLLVVSFCSITSAHADPLPTLPPASPPSWSLIIRPNSDWLTTVYQPALGAPAPASNLGETLARSLGIGDIKGLGYAHSAIVIGTPFGPSLRFYLGKSPGPHGRSGLGFEYRIKLF